MKLRNVTTSVFRIPTDSPEGDGTIFWDSTTMILVEIESESGELGLGYSYASIAAADVVKTQLAPLVLQGDLDQLGAIMGAMIAAVRNVGRPGISSTAISAVDIALWDLKAKLVGVPLFKLLGAYRDRVPIYGSGGFTTYSDAQLTGQLGGWVSQGIPRVKMKIGSNWGTEPNEDLRRVKVARQAIGPETELFIDANGAYSAKQAIGLAQQFFEQGVSYFEEPVSSDQIQQLAFVRDRVPMDVAAGEYGYDPYYFRDTLRAGAVDIIQADATRCLGITGWLQAALLAHSFSIPFSAHTAPSIHAQVGCAAPQLSHVEYFHDHVRIEHMFFEGVPQQNGGYLLPDPARPGLGLELKRKDADHWRVSL